jgi:hypothetical protein
MSRLRLALDVLFRGAPPPRDIPERIQVPEPRSAGPEPATAGPEPPTASPASRATISQLIVLRDKVQMAAEDQDGGVSGALSTVARELGDILELEQTVAFEDFGAFDAARQQVIDTQAADDPAQDYQVAVSVRPGYLQGGEILRRQDVIVYRVDGRSSGGAR